MILDLAILAWGQVAANVRRSLLALIGVAIGVGVLVALRDLGALTEASTTASMSKLGMADVVRIRLDAPEDQLLNPAFSAQIRSKMRFVRQASAEMRVVRRELRNGTKAAGSVTILGVEPSYGLMMNLEVAKGRFLKAGDEGAPVAVVGWRLRQSLGLGSKIVIDGQVFRLVGVLAKNPLPAADEAVFLPYQTMERRLGLEGVTRRIQVKIDDLERLEPYLTELKTFMVRQGLKPAQIHVSDNKRAAAQVLRTTRIMDVFLSVVGLMTLFLGGVGIANTLFASATERIREIGVRKAVGARASHIFHQFLLEALFLCFIGAAAGVVLGWGLVKGISRFMPSSPAQVQLDPLTALAAAGLAVLVGVGFSLWPVVRASRLDVVMALRSA